MMPEPEDEEGDGTMTSGPEPSDDADDTEDTGDTKLPELPDGTEDEEDPESSDGPEQPDDTDMPTPPDTKYETPEKGQMFRDINSGKTYEWNGNKFVPARGA